MASPLSWFRHHQKGMLVVFGVLLMASFGLASVMTSLTPTGNRNDFAMKHVVKYSGGTITNNDFARMRNQHFLAANFLDRFKQMLRASRPDFQERPIMIDVMSADATPDEMNSQIMERFLALKKAEKIGILVSDSAVLQYLRNFASDQSLSQYDFDRICYELLGDNVDFIEVREQLKEELAIQQVKQMYASGIPGVPSITEAWVDFQKLENRIDCQILGFPVEDFIDKVTETPTNSELRKLYEEGKYEFPDIAGERPGFKQRRKLAVAMLSANYQEFLDRAKLAITPEQIKAEYDLLVSANDPIVTEIVPAPTEAGDDNSSGDDPAPTFDGDEPPGTPTDDGAANPPEVENAEGTGSGDVSPESANEPDDDSNNEDGAPETGDETSDDGNSVSASPTKRLSDSNTLFVSTNSSNLRFKQEEKQEGTGSPAPETQEPEQASPETPPVAPEQEGEPPMPQENPPAENESAGDNQDLTAPVQPPTDPPAFPGTDPLTVSDQQIETRIKPLDEKLSDVVRGRLASRPATDEMAVSLAEATAVVNEYGIDFEEWDQSKNGPADERVAEPAPIDPQAIANKYHLQYKSQELSDEVELSESVIGKTIVAIEIPSRFGPQFGTETRDMPISSILFARFHDLGTWQPETFEEYFVPNQHIVFATEKLTPKVLEFADAHAEVEKFWKREKALELAKAAAQKVADDLNSSGRLLSVIDPAGAKNTGGFTWHTMGSPSLYKVFPGNIRPGEEFMEAAFALENNEAGVAPDMLRETVFVVQKIQLDQRTEEEMQELFFQSMATNKGFGNSLGQLHQQQIRELSREFFKQLYEEYQVKWLGD